MDAAVGEHDAKRVILEQSVEGISEMDIDPDRIEVRHILFLLCICFVLSSFSIIIDTSNQSPSIYKLYYCKVVNDK